MDARASRLRGDLATAAALAVLLGIGWTVRDWPSLSALRLPDTDDVMRLQQVRDWLAGQPFADLMQHRLGPIGLGGVPMHWSRLADLGPAALIGAITPFAGRHAAELMAVIAWPLFLFAAALALVARIARVTGGAGTARTAAVVAAVAYPATTVFLPGRIDHHGLQVVLLLAALLATISAPTLRRGIIAGGCAAASLIVGLETAPLICALGVAAAACWAAGERRADRRLTGWGAGALIGLIVGRAVFASDAFAFPACDGFTLDAWRAGIVAAVGALGLGGLGMSRTPASDRFPSFVTPATAGTQSRTAERAELHIPTAARLGPGPCQGGAMRTTTLRWLATLLVGAGTVAGAIVVSPRCLAPYGAVDPMLVRLWLARVGEAQPLFHAPVATAIGYAGVMIAGLAATALRLRSTPSRGWTVLLAVQVAALLVTFAQLRGAYAGAMLAAPALAATITAARARSTLALAGAWLGSAGMLYPIAAAAASKTPSEATGATCSAPAVIARLAVLPPGRLLAPIDTGAWAIAATSLRLVSGPYHRDNAGNLAAYRFFRSAVDAGPPIVAALRVRYVLVCDGDLAPMSAGRASMARRLASGPAPDWLASLPAPAGAHLYAVRR